MQSCERGHGMENCAEAATLAKGFCLGQAKAEKLQVTVSFRSSIPLSSSLCHGMFPSTPALPSCPADTFLFRSPAPNWCQHHTMHTQRDVAQHQPSPQLPPFPAQCPPGSRSHTQRAAG